MKKRTSNGGQMVGMLCLVLMVSGSALGTTLDRGHQLLIDKGFQIQAQIYPATAGSFDLSRWAQSNFTTANVADGTNMSYLGAAPGLPWGRLLGVEGDKTTFVDWDLLFASEVVDAANLVSIQFSDEQSLAGDNLTEAVRMLSLWRTKYPTVIGYTNQSGGQETPATIQNYMAAGQPDMLMMDSYPFLYTSTAPAGNSPTAFYEALQKYRVLALAGNDGTGTTPIPYGAYLQGAKWTSTGHVMSDSEIRLGEFAPWAFGYTFTDLWYYNNTGLTSYPNILFSTQNETSPTAAFYSYAEANRQSRNLGPTLVRLLSTDIRFIAGQNNAGGTPVNNTAPAGISAWDSSSHPYITSIIATNSSGKNGNLRGDVLVGYFKPLRAEDSPGYPNEPYFMILNGLTDATGTAAQTQQSIRIDFDFGSSGIASLQRLNRGTGTVEVVPLTHDSGSRYHLNLVLDGGTGDLFKFNTGAPFVTGSAGGLWADVTYQDSYVKANINGGTDKAGGTYTSNKPDSGTWSMSYNLLGSSAVSVFSAKGVKFLSTGPSAEKAGVLGGADSSLVVKVSLSKYATAAVWDPGSIGYNVAAGSSVQLKYSVDGANFTTVFTAPTGNSSVHPASIPLTFTPGTKAIYLAYVGTIGSGTQAYWNATGGGLTTITPDPRVFAEWTDVLYENDNATVKANVNTGADTGGYAYTVTKPSSGDWTVNYSLAGGTTPVNVWSAYGILFEAGGVFSSGYGIVESASYVMKFNLSEPINSVTWSQARFYRVISPGNSVEAKWSVDGVNWTTCYTFPLPDPTGNYTTPTPVTFAVPSTSVLYLGWFGTLGTGRYCSFETESTGTIQFAPTTVSNWNAVLYQNDSATIRANVNQNADTGGCAYTSVKPASGVWTETYSLGGGTVPLSVWSANYVQFDTDQVESRNWGDKDSSLVMKVNLSDNITMASWKVDYSYRYVNNGGHTYLKYSTDGANWTTLYSITDGTGNENPLPPEFIIPIPAGTTALYVGYFSVVPQGVGAHARFSPVGWGTFKFWAQPSDPTATWTLVEYDGTTTMNNINGGLNAGGQAYTSAKPASGTWSFHYDSAGTTPLKIWAADYMRFDGAGYSSQFSGVSGGRDNRLVLRINLSRAVSSATWTPVRPYYVKTDNVSLVQLKYSADGVNFTTCYTAPNNGVQNPSYPYYFWPGTMNLTFAAPTTTIYIAYTGTVGTGAQAYWQAFGGDLTFSEFVLTRCTYDTGATQANINEGTGLAGYAYTSTRSTAWTENYDLRAGDGPVKVWSADYIEFDNSTLASRNWGDDNNTLILRINLSDRISAATWTPARNYRYVNNGGVAQMKYSADGVNFTTLYTVPDGTGYNSAPLLTMTFPGGTNVVYIGWFGTVPTGSGGHARFNMETSGPLTFTPAGTTPVLDVTPNTQNVDYMAGTTSFAVSNVGGAGMTWSAQVISGGEWLSIGLGGSGTDNGTITLNYAENSDPVNARTATIRITASGAVGSPKDVTVVQAHGILPTPTPTPILPGDANNDGTVNFADFATLQNHYGQSGGWSDGDFNDDGHVTFEDFSILQNHYGESRSSGQAAPAAADNALAGGCLPLGLVLMAMMGLALVFLRHQE